MNINKNVHTGVKQRVNNLIGQFQQGKVSDLPSSETPFFNKEDAESHVGFLTSRHDHFQKQDNSKSDMDPRLGVISLSKEEGKEAEHTVTLQGNSEDGNLLETKTRKDWHSTQATRYTHLRLWKLSN